MSVNVCDMSCLYEATTREVCGREGEKPPSSAKVSHHHDGVILLNQDLHINGETNSLPLIKLGSKYLQQQKRTMVTFNKSPANHHT